MNQQQLDQQLIAIVGIQNIVNDANIQTRYGRNTLGCKRRIHRVVKISEPSQIQAITSVANQHKIGLYPISTGNNWGYGSATPNSHNCIVLDLSSMNRIIHCDANLATVTLEPGVTHQQLSDYFKAHNLPFLVPVHGGGPNCSIVGNAIERGYGITPIADHFSAVTHIEAIMSDGHYYRPLLSEIATGDVDKLYKWGAGPYIDGLLTQSGLGIVTQMTITLARKAKHSEIFLFSVSQDKNMEDVVELIQQTLQHLNGITSSINMINTRRMLSMLVPYPEHLREQQQILSRQQVAELAGQNGLGAWTGFGALYGDPLIIKAAKKIIKQKFKQLPGQSIILSKKRIAQLSFIAKFLPQKLKLRIARLSQTADNIFEILDGSPNEVALPLAYWKNATRPDDKSLNPDRDNCGIRWYTPLVPMDKVKVREYVAFVERVCSDYQIEPLITLTSLSERCFDSSIPLLFDKSKPEAQKRVKDCYQALFEQGRKLGFVPYRYGIDTMELITERPCGFWRVSDAIKQALDPNNIIAPLRYSKQTPNRPDSIAAEYY